MEYGTAGMDFFAQLWTSQIQIGDFFLPWGMVIGTLGFLAAWLVIHIMELKGWTRHVWHLPLFFVALVTLFGCLIGLVLAP